MNEATLRIARDQHAWSFDAERERVVAVESGTIIEIETWDCFTGQVQSELDTLDTIDLSRVNSATGPLGCTARNQATRSRSRCSIFDPAREGRRCAFPGGAS